MSRLLDKRIAFRFPIIIAGAIIANGRRTAASWLSIRYACRGVMVEGRYQAFLATNRIARDVKEVWGAGRQQVRNVWSSIGCWNLCGWIYSLVELECWDRNHEQLVDRSDRPWDSVCVVRHTVTIVGKFVGKCCEMNSSQILVRAPTRQKSTRFLKASWSYITRKTSYAFPKSAELFPNAPYFALPILE
jgi:hypothetical protein